MRLLLQARKEEKAFIRGVVHKIIWRLVLLIALAVGSLVLDWLKVRALELDPWSVVISILVMLFGLHLLRPFVFLWKLALAPAQLDRERGEENQRLQDHIDLLGAVPRLEISFDQKRNVSRNGHEYRIEVSVDGRKGVERASVQIAGIEPAKNKRKSQVFLERVIGSSLLTGLDHGEQQSTTFPIDPKTPVEIPLLWIHGDSFMLNRSGRQVGEEFSLGTYKLTLHAHGKDVQPCRRVFRISKSRSKKRPINLEILQNDGL